MRYPVSTGNSLVIASTRPLSARRVLALGQGNTLPPDLDPLTIQVGQGLEPALKGGAVYTDDRAPVEWLTDLSILRYATGSR